MTESLVVRSKIKEYVKDMNVAGDFSDALSKKCESLIKEAIERAKANGRRTVQSRDL
ncbi:DUF1931 domain-containing protein [Candidatus Woesearchaeota archaeon]|nr:hypothetical protein [uncultured archaeon]AQS33974.1 hypothetical protein [uncultured archaeon]MBS3150257.1 DUF1931 domain-containing protein [Candidatus Woesearchaeota archaeon]